MRDAEYREAPGADAWPDFRRRSFQPELMDDPACDPWALDRTYAYFGTVNRLVAFWWPVYVRQLRPRLRRERANTLLDIGCGGGDVTRQLQAWAARDGFTLRALGIDADERAIAYARSRPERSGLEFRRVMSGVLVGEGAGFDFIVSNHLLHHLGADELRALLADCEALCRGRVLHSDIERHPLAWAGFGLLTAPFFRGSFITPDGMRSVQRSFTHAELHRAAPRGWQVERPAPFRLLLTWDAPRRQEAGE